MKKSIGVLAVGMFIATAGAALACDGCDKGMSAEKMDDMKPPMKHEMMGMMERTVVATSDGGVVIVKGHHLIKYDRNLKLVNEVDLPGMPGRMSGKKKDHACPGMKQKSEGNKGVVNSASKADEHKAHH